MKNKKYMFSILLFIFLFFGTYYFVLKDYSLDSFKLALNSCDIRYIGLAILLLISSCFFAGLYLKRTLKHFKQDITWYQALGYFFTETYFSAITPSSVGGQPVEMVEMHKDKIPYRINSIVILLNTLLYKVVLIVLAMILITIYGRRLIFSNFWFSILMSFGFVSNLLMVLLFIVLIYSKKTIVKLGNGCLKFLEKIHILKNREEKEQELADALKDYQGCARFTREHPFILLEQFIILFFQRITILSIPYIIYLAFGFNSFSYFEVLTLQIGITLACDFIPFPGGVGISEGLLLQVNQMLYGSIFATSAMILFRGISFYILVLFSGLFYMIFHFRKRKRV